MLHMELLEHIRALPIDERKELIKQAVDSLAEASHAPMKKRSLRELRGLGKEIWQGVDVESYINQLRDEWDNR